MSLALGDILRFIGGGLRLGSLVCEQLAKGADAANITVSWEFAAISVVLLAQKRWGWFAIVTTLSFIVAFEKGGDFSLTLRWIEHVSRGAGDWEGTPQLS
jgi:hypothetical protein